MSVKAEQAQRQVRTALERGAREHEFEADLWTLKRVGLVAEGVADQDWLILERLPAYAPELNPVELLCSSPKKRELANFAGGHLAEIVAATEQGTHRINQNPQLPWSLPTHTGLHDQRA
ncbi:hypothetical protein [Streptomyces sp. NPDC088748]|uniref:hypothetical protein n=1 Tax=Streptomyces sp. NPDC088748 TaxID=3365887 RepID=UPI00382F2F63